MKSQSRGAKEPAVPNAYGLQSSGDMLMKLDREMARLASANGQQDVIDHGLNVAMTAWHLVDWVWTDIKRLKRLPDWLVVAGGIGVPAGALNDADAFKNYALKQCPELRYCQIITTSAKHFRYGITRDDPEFKSAALAPGPITWRNKWGQPIYFVNNQGERVTFISEAWGLWIIEGEERRRAVEVYERANAWWRQLIHNLPSHGH
jgi:hypothetical protein